MNIRVYHTLPGDAVMIREEVFMKEQGFHDEFDETDQTASHIVLYIENIPAATCRFFSGQPQGEYIVGRIAVRKEYRGHSLGSRVLAYGEPDFDEDCPHIWMQKELT